jgi:hypothetical protein
MLQHGVPAARRALALGSARRHRLMIAREERGARQARQGALTFRRRPWPKIVILAGRRRCGSWRHSRAAMGTREDADIAGLGETLAADHG